MSLEFSKILDWGWSTPEKKQNESKMDKVTSDSNTITVGSFSIESCKVSRVSYRHSLLWWRSPYVTEIVYHEPHTSLITVGKPPLVVPITKEYKIHKVKCDNESAAKKVAMAVMEACPHLKE
ncbi:MAG: hypothetical protein VX777_03090 [Chlamydiota bacterium]|nr:hypothetical protein [Chlamydiota bacterium]